MEVSTSKDVDLDVEGGATSKAAQRRMRRTCVQGEELGCGSYYLSPCLGANYSLSDSPQSIRCHMRKVATGGEPSKQPARHL